MALKLDLRRISHPSDSSYAEELQKILDEVGRVLVKKMAVKNILSAKGSTVKSFDDNDFFDPESALAFYNRTKTEFGVLYKNCSIHLCSRRTTSWYIALFYRLVNMSTITKYILHQGYSYNLFMNSIVFLKALLRNLVLPLSHTRIKNTSINHELNLRIKRILG
ncbi:hypothetical protein CDAR_376171 [Caerostris darwini]|uniref:Uncharacterized protein n=1 Tax=Caerostris darwini TaxID=1538125 RepID=A0AAV4VEJ7_9ARAC|nr:hypothetical protein CDAR_376171 [Caerostris darwini]